MCDGVQGEERLESARLIQLNTDIKNTLKEVSRFSIAWGVCLKSSVVGGAWS